MTGPPKSDGGPPEGTAATKTPKPHLTGNQPVSDSHSNAAWCHGAALKRRRGASWRSPALSCGCQDPDSARHYGHDPAPWSDNQITGYADAARYILETTGLTPILPADIVARLWERGGADRALAEKIRAAGAVS